jgi:hypothetical protein
MTEDLTEDKYGGFAGGDPDNSRDGSRDGSHEGRDAAAQDEKALLLRVAAGEEPAFALIVDRYWGKLYAVAMDFLKSGPDAEDIVQEVFMKLWVKREGLAMIERFDSWLFIVARNQIISRMRIRGPQPLPKNSFPRSLPIKVRIGVKIRRRSLLLRRCRP